MSIATMNDLPGHAVEELFPEICAHGTAAPARER